jgi:hypothetical protein
LAITDIEDLLRDLITSNSGIKEIVFLRKVNQGYEKLENFPLDEINPLKFQI